MDAADFLSQLKALLPTGKAWPRGEDNDIHTCLACAAPEFARVQERADKLLLEANPPTSEELLPEWEWLLSLPDPCATAPTTVEGRQRALAARLVDDIGHNPADYVAVAVGFGHVGAEVIRRPYPPCCAGRSAAGDPAYDDAWAFAFFVGYMANLLDAPQDFETGWATDAGTPTVEPNVARGPDGTLTATRISDAVTFVRSYEIAQDDVPTDQTEFSVWLKSESGLVNAEISLRTDNVAAEFQPVIIDQSWNRFTVRLQSDSATYRAGIAVDDGGSFLAWGASITDVDSTFECRMRHIAQAHTVPIFGRIGEFHPFRASLYVDGLGNLLVDENGFLLT
jgi:uncharacterized protein YmfQ (DUF2313 family)